MHLLKLSIIMILTTITVIVAEEETSTPESPNKLETESSIEQTTDSESESSLKPTVSSPSVESTTNPTSPSTTSTQNPTTSFKCNTCMENMIRCLNTTSYNWCFDGQTPSEVVNHCEQGYVCTSTNEVCVARSAGGKPVCEEECGTCLANNMYACTSSNEFASCSKDGVMSPFRGKCLANEYCNIEMYKSTKIICWPACAYQPTCLNNQEEVDPVISINATDICKRNQANVPGFFWNDKDLMCISYAYCEEVKGELIAIAIMCADGTYFSKKLGKCIDQKSEGCV